MKNSNGSLGELDILKGLESHDTNVYTLAHMMGGSKLVYTVLLIVRIGMRVA